MSLHTPHTRAAFRRIAPAAMLIFASTQLFAQQPLSLTLSGNAEVPPVTTSARGVGQITVLADHTVTGTIRTEGFEPTKAHIHDGAINANGPAIVTLEKITTSSFTVPPNTKLTDAQYSRYVAGNLYVNVHSAKYPDGEIRAQLLRAETASTPMRPAY